MKRNTRSYKEKKPLITFGQFILPLIVLMAIALLFFSVKLFFIDTPEAPHLSDEKTEVVASETSGDVSKPEVKVVEPSKEHKEEAVKVPIAKPVPTEEPKKKTETVAKPQAVKTKPTSPTPQSKEAAKNKESGAKKENTTKTETKPAVAGSLSRWDVQIGGFASKDGALLILKKARSEGNEAYISETKRDGAPFYRVRVIGPKTRADAQKLAAKLEQQGYPIYLVEIKK